MIRVGKVMVGSSDWVEIGRGRPRIAATAFTPVSRFSSLPDCRCRSEEHTSELQSLMRISYAVFCLKKKNLLQHKLYIKQRVDTHTERDKTNTLKQTRTS